jgi:hypothetical protein
MDLAGGGAGSENLNGAIPAARPGAKKRIQTRNQTKQLIAHTRIGQKPSCGVLER